MSEPVFQGHSEVRNSFKNEGPLGPPNMVALTCTGGGGLISIRGAKNNVTQVMGNAGGGLVIATPAASGLGDGKSPPTGERGTKHFANDQGDKSRPTMCFMANPDGTGISIDSGGGRSPTMHLSTSDGLCSITITSAGGGAIILRVGTTEFVVNGAKGQTETTKQVIQEKIDHREELEAYRKNMLASLKNALKPYSDSA